MIYYIIGIRRSGIHAIANWLFPMMGEFIYLNNYELGKLSENELVINGKFNVLIGIENKHVNEVMKYCTNGKRIWVRRDFEEVKRSQQAWYSKVLSPPEVMSKLVFAKLLDNEYKNIPATETVINYNEWNTSDGYRQMLIGELGLNFDDRNKKKVFGYGVSSFDNASL